ERLLMKLLNYHSFYASRSRHTRWARAGVQTCALPISPAMVCRAWASLTIRRSPGNTHTGSSITNCTKARSLGCTQWVVSGTQCRSEERRVGGAGRGRLVSDGGCNAEVLRQSTVTVDSE